MFDIEKFKLEVKERRALYDVQLPEWEVGTAIFVRWDDLTFKERKEKEHELITKWKSLRDQFRKGLKLQQSSKSEYAPTFSNILNEDREDVFEDDDSSVNTIPSLTEPSTSNKKKTLVQTFLEFNKDISNVMHESINIQKNNVQRQNRDDRGNEAFFRSMLPLMDKINDDYFIYTRTEIMAVIKKYIPPSHTLTEAYSRTSTPTSEYDIAQIIEHFDGM